MTERVSVDKVANAGIKYEEVIIGILFSGSVGTGRT